MPEVSASLQQYLASLAVSFDTVFGALPWLCTGASISVLVVACALAIGFCLGVPFSILQIYGNPVCKRAVAIYVWFFRGVPILVLLFLFYFGIAYQLHIDISPFVASCLVLGLTSTAYQSQIFRGAIMSLPSGQMRAALAVGMSKSTAIRSIILPQALRLSIPGWSNEFSILLKDSVLVSVLGTMELMSRTKAVATRTKEYTAFFIAAAIIYFIITLIGTRLLAYLEKKTRVPGYNQHQADA